MDSFFALIAGASLFFSWLTTGEISKQRAAWIPTVAPCSASLEYQSVASYNATTLKSASLSPFGRAEQGWQVYEPQVAAMIGTTCAADTKEFAKNLAVWQQRNQLSVTGAINTETLGHMKNKWQHKRAFIADSGHGCPNAASDAALSSIASDEGWLGKPGKLETRALNALRHMVAAARAADRRIANDPHMLTIVSAFRSPAYDAAKCKNGNCNGIAKARCSAHRTGTAVDLYVGAAPGHSPVDTKDANRLYQSQTPAYRWLVKHAARYGFVNYVFEPWHWEYVGQPIRARSEFAAIK